MSLAELAEALRGPATSGSPMSQVGEWNITRLESARRRGRVKANKLGHVLSAWENDTPMSMVATCLVCEELAAVDASWGQPTEYVGRALTSQCAGPYSRGVIR